MKRLGLIAISILVISQGGCQLGYQGTITVKVVDESGLPVKGALVGVSFTVATWNDGPKVDNHEGLSDAAGLFTVTGRGGPSVGVSAEKEGYYKSSGGFSFFHDQVPTNGVWHTDNPIIILVLRPKGFPISMYAKIVDSDELLEDRKQFSFDLFKGDWVNPYGEGEHGDLTFTLVRSITNNSHYLSSLTVAFTNGVESGLIPYPVARDQFRSKSELRMPGLAPSTGYVPEHTIYAGLLSPKFTTNEYSVNVSTIRDDMNYYIRVRGTNYGKIYGDFVFSGNYPTNMKARLSFKYYMNPTGSRNVEFNTESNLLPYTGRGMVSEP